MDDVVLATRREDAEAAEAVERHHAELAAALGLRVGALLRAATAEPSAAENSRRELVAWLEQELVPHALAEEQAMYPAAHRLPAARLLVDGMLAEHKVLIGLVREIASAPDAVSAAAAAKALQVLFDSHLAKENDQALPLLLSAPGVSVAELLGGMHELLGGSEHRHRTAGEDGVVGSTAGGCGGHSCGCGEVDSPDYPELDARAVPHAIQHATVFGALDAVPAGSGMVLVAPHDPLPLLDQIATRYDGAFIPTYVERGPEAWRLLLERSA